MRGASRAGLVGAGGPWAAHPAETRPRESNPGSPSPLLPPQGRPGSARGERPAPDPSCRSSSPVAGAPRHTLNFKTPGPSTSPARNLESGAPRPQLPQPLDAGLTLTGAARALGSRSICSSPRPSQSPGVSPRVVKAHLGRTGRGPGRAGPSRTAFSPSAVLSL